MTQTIHDCAAITAGKTYPVEHLRTAESIERLCEYVNAGHPIATVTGYLVRLLRRLDRHRWHYDWLNSYKTIEPYWAAVVVNSDTELLGCVKLAPLAYRNGRPLHLGDDIVLGNDEEGEDDWRVSIRNFGEILTLEWRFADEELA